MPNNYVSKFNIDDKELIVKDSEARNTANTASTNATNALNRVTEYKELLLYKTNELNRRISTIIADGQQTEGNTELIDIRTGADGKVYPTAGDAVRVQIGALSEGNAELKDLVNIRSIPYDVNNYSNDLKKDIDYESGKTIVLSSLKGLNIHNYKEKMSPSSVAAISDVYKIAKGTVIKYSYTSTQLNNAIICITFDKNGEFLEYYTGLTFDSQKVANATYALFIIYPKLNQKISYSFFNEEFIYNNIGKTYIVGDGGDYKTFTEAIKALKGNETKKTIKILPGEYDLYSELGGDTFANAISTTEWRKWNEIIPKNTLIEGVGVVKLIFNCTSNNSKAISVLSPINAETNVKIKNLTIEGSNCRYCVHYENSASSEYKNSVFGIDNCKILKRINNIAAIGIGLESGSILDIANTTIQSDYYGMYIHTDYNANNCQVRIMNCLIENSYLDNAILIDNIYATTKPQKESCFTINNTHLVNKIVKRFNNTCDEWHITAYRTNISAVTQTGEAVGDIIESNIYN